MLARDQSVPGGFGGNCSDLDFASANVIGLMEHCQRILMSKRIERPPDTQNLAQSAGLF